MPSTQVLGLATVRKRHQMRRRSLFRLPVWLLYNFLRGTLYWFGHRPNAR